MDDVNDKSRIYNENLCRICQTPERLDLVKTDTTTSGNGDTYLDLLKFIFEDIFWIEDELISLACKTCLEKVTDIAEFKRLCLETNGRRGALVNVELVAIKLEDTQQSASEDDEPISDVDISLEDLKQLKNNAMTKRKRKDSTSEDSEDESKRKKKILYKALVKHEKSDSEYEDNTDLDDTEEDIENENKDDETNGSRKSLNLPRLQAINQENLCRTCKKKFLNLNDLEEHFCDGPVKTRSRKRKYRCDICHESFKAKDPLDRHMFRHNGTRNYICTVCGKKYVTDGDLCRHKKLHELNEDTKFVCDICPDKKFNSKSNLRTHKVIVHTDPKDYKHLCTECGTKFSTGGALKEHMLRHNNIKKFPCNMCDKSFISKLELQRHMPSHSNVREFKCDLCPSEYKHKAQLLIHKTKRHNVGNYKFNRIREEFDCRFCDKKILSRDKLQRHLRTHTGVKPYTCKLCNQKFICNSYIKGHMRTKHDVNVDAPDYKTSQYYDVCDDEVSKCDATRPKPESTDSYRRKVKKK